MYRYRAFELTIASEIRLDELSPEPDVHADVDIHILLRDLGVELPPMGAPTQINFEGADGLDMMWPGAAMVRIRSPSIIHVQPFPQVPETYLAFPLLGPVMGWVLHMRGFYVLHGSAVEKSGRSVAFVGDKTAGKSTTASAFLKQGWSLMTDDLLALDVSDEARPLLQPAFGQLKLNADTLDTHIPGAQLLPLVMDGFRKRQYRLADMVTKPVAAGLIFVLERGGEYPAISWYEPGEAIAALFRYSYNLRFVDAPADQQDRARQFRQAIAIANSARIGRLQVPHDRDRLAETVAYIELAISTEAV